MQRRKKTQQNPLLSKVDDFATLKKVEVYAENSTIYRAA